MTDDDTHADLFTTPDFTLIAFYISGVTSLLTVSEKNKAVR